MGVSSDGWVCLETRRGGQESASCAAFCVHDAGRVSQSRTIRSATRRAKAAGSGSDEPSAMSAWPCSRWA